MIKVGDKYLRNLEEQVQYLTNYHDVNQGIAQWGIRVIDQVETVEELNEIDTTDLEYGDAVAVGTQSPFFFYIWTRASIEGQPAYWFPFGEISTVGPQGQKGDKGDKGDRGESTRWYTGFNVPYRDDSLYNPGDIFLVVVGSEAGNVYIYVQDQGFQFSGNIKGPQGIQGLRGIQGPQGIQGPVGPKGDKGDAGKFINIFGTLNNVNQLPNPSSLNNLTAAYLVGTTSPYNLFIQVGSTSDTAVWVNAGPFNAATLVTVNGSGQNVWNADTKLDKSIFDNFNLKNGTANGSLEQKDYVKASNLEIVPGAIASGEGAVAFGGQRFDKVGKHVSEEPQTEAKGKQSFAAGGGVIVNGNWSAGFGKDNIVDGKAAFSVGGGNIVKEVLDNDGNVSYSFSIALGESNEVHGRSSVALGSTNHLEKFGSYSIGYGNKIYGKQSGALGTGNQIDAENATSIGHSNFIHKLHNFSTLIGTGLRSSNKYQTVSGRFNAPSGGVFVVGNGNNNEDRKNAFVVMEDGRAKVYKGPEEDEDVATKDYVDNAVASAGGGKLYAYALILRSTIYDDEQDFVSIRMPFYSTKSNLAQPLSSGSDADTIIGNVVRYLPASVAKIPGTPEYFATYDGMQFYWYEGTVLKNAFVNQYIQQYNYEFKIVLIGEV